LCAGTPNRDDRVSPARLSAIGGQLLCAGCGLGEHFNPNLSFGIAFPSNPLQTYVNSSLFLLVLGLKASRPVSLIWGPSKSLLKYDTFSLSNLRIPGPEAPRLILLNLGCPDPYSNIASRLQSEPPGFNLSLQASISASSLQSEPPGSNLSLEASI
jgi:hypothetical protein